MKSPKIVAVPEKMQKYYGTGSMLHPEIGMVEEAIALVPFGKVITIDTLARALAQTYGADVTCPLRIGNHLKRLSKTASQLPFWRVVRTDGYLIKFDNWEYWATVLAKEGFVLKFTKSNQVKVGMQSHQLFQFSIGGADH
ncbi:hypothetical protein FK220_001520 [Flavobacteriaceae bacterium TP-CH-4]|uniref:Methylated-DNA-[protein]-cysteine S-methyltransferase DNA binding domain-containing protein n=1 Tax=Pelagihabitans pacificus TaxID=2696054 RepID=A0A967ARR4_9FLAO|nr:MGMT family protein [Pelagihabitans pacificus]NHF58000.1 hypothetical protein [Pelagihabitans pacificus]